MGSPVTVSLLGLHRYIPIKDVKRLIFAYLTPLDVRIALLAHNRSQEARVNQDRRLCGEIAAEGHVELLEWARLRGCRWGEWTCRQAAEGGHLPLLRWLREQCCPWDMWTICGAARAGRREVVQWACDNGCPQDWQALISAAADVMSTCLTF